MHSIELHNYVISRNNVNLITRNISHYEIIILSVFVIKFMRAKILFCDALNPVNIFNSKLCNRKIYFFHAWLSLTNLAYAHSWRERIVFVSVFRERKYLGYVSLLRRAFFSAPYNQHIADYFSRSFEPKHTKKCRFVCQRTLSFLDCIPLEFCRLLRSDQHPTCIIMHKYREVKVVLIQEILNNGSLNFKTFQHI